MKVLWLTPRFPYPPAQGGDMIYSRNLIAATAAAGAEISVLCLDGHGVSGDGVAADGVVWLTGGQKLNPNWHSLFSLHPNIAKRFLTADIGRKLKSVLDREQWQAIIFDNIATGGYFSAVSGWAAQKKMRPLLVHVAHNHQATTYSSIATNLSLPWYMRLVHRLNAVKGKWLEQRLVNGCHLSAANTEDDLQLFLADKPRSRFIVLQPAYDGARVTVRDISAVDQVALVLGSFQWVAKKLNLLSFLEAAAPVFPAKNIRLRVVGMMDDDFKADLVARFAWAEIVGKVDAVDPELRLARIGIVPEISGGGFKHKILNYVFNRVAVVGIANGMAGVGLRSGMDCISASNMDGLVAAIAGAIDDVPRLQALTDCAYENCHDRFDWKTRGQEFVAAMKSEYQKEFSA